MNYKKWFENNTKSLKGKTVAISGATGGLGKQLCFHLAFLNADLVLLNRSRPKTEALIKELNRSYPSVSVSFIPLDLESIESVRSCAGELEKREADILIHNAGAYDIPRRKTDIGLDNVFQINCIAPIYLTELLSERLKKRGAKTIFVGSIAHNYSKTDEADIDFSKRSASSKVYGNAKRHMMLSVFEHSEVEREANCIIAHPGITLTNITAHYPKLIFTIIKYPMKVIFMSPKKAALCIIKGIFEPCGYGEWVGPRFFDVWGLPKKKRLKTFTCSEAQKVYASTKSIIKNI